jgi:iron complex outermembrane receptor protein
LRSFLDLPGGWQLDGQFRKLTAVRTLPGTGERMPGYAELDLRLAWRDARHLEISLTGQNLLHRRHAEFGSPAARGEFERGVYGKIAWDF